MGFAWPWNHCNISPIFLARVSFRKRPNTLDPDEKFIRALFVLRGRVIKDWLVYSAGSCHSTIAINYQQFPCEMQYDTYVCEFVFWTRYTYKRENIILLAHNWNLYYITQLPASGQNSECTIKLFSLFICSNGYNCLCALFLLFRHDCAFCLRRHVTHPNTQHSGQPPPTLPLLLPTDSGAWWPLSAHRGMRTTTNYFLLNLSFADLLMSSLNCMFNFIYMLNSDWPFGGVHCSVNMFVGNITVASSVFTLVAISFNRYGLSFGLRQRGFFSRLNEWAFGRGLEEEEESLGWEWQAKSVKDAFYRISRVGRRGGGREKCSL